MKQVLSFRACRAWCWLFDFGFWVWIERVALNDFLVYRALILATVRVWQHEAKTELRVVKLKGGRDGEHRILRTNQATDLGLLPTCCLE